MRRRSERCFMLAAALIALPVSGGCHWMSRCLPSEPSPPVTAFVSAVTWGRESGIAVTLEMPFSNHLDREVTVDSYQIAWQGGHEVISGVDFSIAPRGSDTRQCSIPALPEKFVKLPEMTLPNRDEFRVDVLCAY
jgi:hypothetical protein